jgi:hypothetical protein
MFIGRPKLEKSVENVRTTHGEELHSLYSPNLPLRLRNQGGCDGLVM